jgi:hypothetical protein
MPAGDVDAHAEIDYRIVVEAKRRNYLDEIDEPDERGGNLECVARCFRFWHGTIVLNERLETQAFVADS